MGPEKEASTLLEDRKPPVGTWYDNTTVTGSWIETQDIGDLSKQHGRLVNNATIAMPHAGVFSAAHDPLNNIRQPKDFDGEGEFTVHASVASPALNVLCAGGSSQEMEPFVGDVKGKNNPNHTVFDDLFDFGDGEGHQARPIFQKLPIAFNTVHSGSMDWPNLALYVLAASPSPRRKFNGPKYVLCSIKGGMTPGCSTEYHAKSSGGTLRANCESGNPLAHEPNTKGITFSPNWRSVGDEWAKAVSFNSGVSDSNSSNVEILTQTIPEFHGESKSVSLDPKMPSIAEALAALGSSTLLLSSQDTPFISQWPYDEVKLSKPVLETFNGSLIYTDYASGGTQSWRFAFHIVLASVFIINVFCLVYFYVGIRGIQITDFTEPQNLFSLALNSPPSYRVQGSCGVGPEGDQLCERWVINMKEDDEHYYLTSQLEEKEALRRQLEEAQPSPEPSATYDNKDRMKVESPVITEYRRLSQNRNSLSLLT